MKIKEIWQDFCGWLCYCWRPPGHDQPRCMYDSSRYCHTGGCQAYSKEEILLIVSDIKENQQKTRCLRLAIEGARIEPRAHIEALKLFSDKAVRELVGQLCRKIKEE